MSRVFLDANVLFSAAYSDAGAVRSLFDVVEKRGDTTLIATGYVVREARRNLQRKAPARVAALETLLQAVTVVAEPHARLVEELGTLVPDPADAPVLAVAVHAGADYLVTGNERDFGPLYGERIRGVLVLRPRDVLDLFIG